jgi:hypothetical protein
MQQVGQQNGKKEKEINQEACTRQIQVKPYDYNY